MPVALDVAAFHREAGWMPAVRVVLEAPEAAVWTVGSATPTWYRFQLSRTPGLCPKTPKPLNYLKYAIENLKE